MVMYVHAGSGFEYVHKRQKPVDCFECSRGWGDGGDCERGPQKDVASRSNLSVCPGFEHISTLIYYIFVF